VLLFPERLQAAGIHTVAVHAHGYFRPRRAGLDQGFDRWELLPNLRWDATTDVEITGDRMLDAARRVLSDPETTRGRFFAWFHFMDPHDQYRAHPGIPPWGPTLRDRYDGEVTFVDRQVGELVRWLRAQPWGARTVVIVTADHGEGFGEHGEFRHGFEVWQELVRVPWFFLGPGLSPRRITTNRSHLDLGPTVLALFGLPPEPGFTGQSLVPELYGAQAPARDVLVDLARTSDNDRRRALIHDHYKVTAYGDDHRFEAWDLTTDPQERSSLARSDRPLFQSLVARYRAAQGTITEVHPVGCRNLRGAPPGRGW
jgi:arylsulfatase A-like enzyme